MDIKELITEEEIALIKKLGDAYNDFCSLEELHPMDEQEFMVAIHMAQNIILSRPGLRHLSVSKPQPRWKIRSELLKKYG